MVVIPNYNFGESDDVTLAAGFSPLLIRPTNLVFYAPLIATEDYDRVGGIQLAVTGSLATAPHPPIYNPTSPQSGIVVVAPSFNLEEAAHNYIF